MLALPLSGVKWLLAHWRAAGVAVLVIAVGLGALRFISETGSKAPVTRSLALDGPPPEFLYLDTERTLAYLGEIRGGLSEVEKRMQSAKATQTANIKSSLASGLSADLNASRERQQAIEEVVTPKATDRFVTLLHELRSGRSGRGDTARRWLHSWGPTPSCPSSRRRSASGATTGAS